jgi:hypothetical protein
MLKRWDDSNEELTVRKIRYDQNLGLYSIHGNNEIIFDMLDKLEINYLPISSGGYQILQQEMSTVLRYFLEQGAIGEMLFKTVVSDMKAFNRQRRDDGLEGYSGI